MVAVNKHIDIAGVSVGNDLDFVLIAGPCALESKEHAFEMCHALVEMTSRLKLSFIYKTSFDKGNRTSITASRGMGINEGLPILAELREKFGCPVLTDVHSPEQCMPSLSPWMKASRTPSWAAGQLQSPQSWFRQ